MEQEAGMIIIYTTFASENDAGKVGRELVEEKLAACVNIFPGMTSIYRWQGSSETAGETAMLVKTRKDLQTPVLEALVAKHPYSVPALIVFEPVHVAAAYLDWLHKETA